MINEPTRPQPFIAVPPGALSRHARIQLRKAGYLVIESKAALAEWQRPTFSPQDRAALTLARWLLEDTSDYNVGRKQVCTFYTSELLKIAPISK
jgi:hypothetical protein